MCGFTQETEKDQFDWTRSKGETPSSNTGPSGDHTCRAKGAGKKCGDLLLSDEYGVIHSFGKTNFFILVCVCGLKFHCFQSPSRLLYMTYLKSQSAK